MHREDIVDHEVDVKNVRAEKEQAARGYASRAGYAVGGGVAEERREIENDEKQDKADIALGVHKHERNMHRGERETKLARGGHVDGEAPMHRADKRARGGGLHSKGKGLTVVVHNSNPGERMVAAQQGMKLGAALGARHAAATMAGAAYPRRPVAGPAPMPPPGLGAGSAPGSVLPSPGPGASLPPFAKGGKIDGGGALKRVQRTHEESGGLIPIKAHHRHVPRRRGGSCEE